MLRIAVLVLLAANILYFGWSHWAVTEPPVLGAVTAADTAVARATQPHLPPPPCATLGPFRDEVLALQAEKLLAKSGWTPERRTVGEDVNDGWWVYVATPGAAAQARTLEAIRRSGMNDAFAMTDDPEFRVSVGLFSEEQRAQDRAARIQRLKFDAIVKERRKQRSVTWFDLPGVAREALMSANLGAGLPLDALRIEACPVSPGASSVDAAAQSGADAIGEASADAAREGV